MRELKRLTAKEAILYNIIVESPPLKTKMFDMRKWTEASIITTFINSIFPTCVLLSKSSTLKYTGVDILLLFCHVLRDCTPSQLKGVSTYIHHKCLVPLKEPRKTYSITGMNDTEDMIFQLINNNKELHEWVYQMANRTPSYVRHDMDTIYRCHIDQHMHEHLKKPCNHELVFVHLIDSMGLIDKLHNVFIDNYINVDSEECVVDIDYASIENKVLAHYSIKEPRIGDRVIHSCGSGGKEGKDTVVIISEDINNECYEKNAQRWIVKYDKNGNEGSWLKKYCIFPTIGSLDEPSSDIENLHNVQNEISEHLRKAADHFDKVAEHLPPVTNRLMPERTMSNECTIITKTEVNGVDVDNMDAGALLHVITNTEDRINKMKARSEKSAYIKQESARLQAFVDGCYKILDEKFVTEKPSENNSES